MAQSIRTCWHGLLKATEAAERHEFSNSNLLTWKHSLGPLGKLFCFTRKEVNQPLPGQFPLEVFLLFSLISIQQGADTNGKNKSKWGGLEALFWKGLPLDETFKLSFDPEIILLRTKANLWLRLCCLPWMRKLIRWACFLQCKKGTIHFWVKIKSDNLCKLAYWVAVH